MQIKPRILLLALPLLAAACSDNPESDSRPRTVRVTVGSDPRIDLGAQAGSRTSIGNDGETVRWNGDDTIALWALDAADGTPAFEAHPFAMFHYNTTYNSAKFTADIPPMQAGTYRYCAVAPRPKAVAGTLATFDIPAIQKFRTAELGAACTALPYDVAVATPVTASELVEGDNSEGVNLTFRHKVHLLKVVVEGNELGEKVSEMVITFPEPVAGSLTVDVADPDAASVLTGGGNTLTLRFDNPVEPGTTVFAAIAPADFTGRDITIVAYGETGESLVRTIVPRKEFAAGHTTPIRYTIPVMGRLFTRLTFALAKDAQDNPENFLGEPVQQITLTAPAGATFDNGLAKRILTPDAEGNYTLTFKPSWQDGLSEQTLTAQFESEHAIVTGPITIPAIRPYEPNSAAYRVPYLFEEDFSGTTTHNVNGGLSSSGHDGATEWGDAYGLAGWSGNQYYIEGGKAIVIRHQAEKYFLLGTYRGRVDSCPIKGIKDGMTVKVSVSFVYNGKTSTSSNNLPVMHYGSTTNQNALSGYYQGGSSTISGGNKIEYEAGTVTAPTNGSFDNIGNSINFMIDGCTNQRRLSWDCYITKDKSGTTQQWIFIDNVKVSIAQ